MSTTETILSTITPSTTDQEKHELAQRIGKTMNQFGFIYRPEATMVDASLGRAPEYAIHGKDVETDVDSLGYCFQIQDYGNCWFPDFGFDVWIDGRENDGDLAQSVVDELQAIADAYAEVAKTMAERLGRTPQQSKSKWLDWQDEMSKEDLREWYKVQRMVREESREERRETLLQANK